MERVTGIEPAYRAWEARVLPLNYTRDTNRPHRRLRGRQPSMTIPAPRVRDEHGREADAGGLRTPSAMVADQRCGPHGWSSPPVSTTGPGRRHLLPRGVVTRGPTTLTAPELTTALVASACRRETDGRRARGPARLRGPERGVEGRPARRRTRYAASVIVVAGRNGRRGVHNRAGMDQHCPTKIG